MEKSDFTLNKTKIRSQLKSGDLKKIVSVYNVSQPTINRALQKNSVEEMTTREVYAWNSILEFVEEKDNEIEKLKQKTSNLAQKIQ